MLCPVFYYINFLYLNYIVSFIWLCIKFLTLLQNRWFFSFIVVCITFVIIVVAFNNILAAGNRVANNKNLCVTSLVGGGGGVLPYSLGGGVPLGLRKSYPLLDQILQFSTRPKMLNCSWLQSFVSHPIKQDPILDQFSMITRPYTRPNGLKTIPSTRPLARAKLRVWLSFPTAQNHLLCLCSVGVFLFGKLCRGGGGGWAFDCHSRNEEFYHFSQMLVHCQRGILPDRRDSHRRFHFKWKSVMYFLAVCTQEQTYTLVWVEGKDWVTRHHPITHPLKYSSGQPTFGENTLLIRLTPPPPPPNKLLSSHMVFWTQTLGKIEIDRSSTGLVLHT